jgi:hypothetical protein
LNLNQPLNLPRLQYFNQSLSLNQLRYRTLRQNHLLLKSSRLPKNNPHLP